MKILMYGKSTGHSKGSFSLRYLNKVYFFSEFLTDYQTEIDGKLIEGKAGDVLIAHPGDIVYHGPTADMQKGFVNDWIRISGDEISALLSRYPLPRNKAFRIADRGMLARAIASLEQEMKQQNIGWEERCYLIFADFIIKLYRSYTEENEVLSSDKLDELRKRMQRDIRSEWTVEKMAQLTGYSQSRFCALFKEKFGVSAMELLIRERVEQAKLMLAHSDLPISSVSELCGFATLYYFSRTFNARVGKSPSEYRKEAHLS